MTKRSVQRQISGAGREPISDLIVIELLADTCVDSTVRYATGLGYEVTMVRDCDGRHSRRLDLFCQNLSNPSTALKTSLGV